MENTDQLPLWEEDEAQDKAQRMAEIDQALSVFGAGIETLAEQAERDRKPIERRWIDDLRQFKGSLSTDEAGNIKAGESEQVFNITRNKTEGAYSRISGMLFQSDGNNWGITATPVQDNLPPQLPSPQQPPQLPPQSGPSPVQNGQPGGPVSLQVPQETPQEQAQRQADAKAELMEDEIKDQLAESDYEVVGRQQIRSACIYGTGVVKGPVIQSKKKNSWNRIDGQDGKSIQELQVTYQDKAAVEFVPLWDYFPDMSATRREDCEYEFQRHYMSRKSVFGLLNRDDFIPSQVEKLLLTVPDKVPPDYLGELRQMAGYSQGMEEKKYLVWEYHGMISVEDLMLCGNEFDDGEELRPEYEGIVWISQGIVLKAHITPLDTQERPFSVLCYERDDSCIFGEGVPRLVRNPQKSINSCWQKIQDNSGLAVGPQTIVDDDIIEPVPVDGKISWELEPKKVWRKKNPAKDIRAAFHQFKIDSAMGELQAILVMARQFADEETMLPLIAQGEQAGHVTKTAHGMELLMNSANDMMRRVTKDFDDNCTVPLITRFYDWNMQFSDKEEIKGDMAVEAKGTSALLLKETQATNLLNLLKFGAATPLAGLTKWGDTGRELAKAMQLDPEKIFLTDEEAKALQQNSQDDGIDQIEGAKIQIEMQKLELLNAQHREKMASAENDRQAKMAIAEYALQAKIMDIASKEKITVEQAAARLKEIETNIFGKEHLLAQEAKIAITKDPEQKGL